MRLMLVKYILGALLQRDTDSSLDDSDNGNIVCVYLSATVARRL